MRHRAPATRRRGKYAALPVAGALVGVLGTAGTAAATELRVDPGAELVTTVRGFAPGALVHRRLDGRVLAEISKADDSGAVELRLRAPRRPGAHSVVLIGAVPVADSAGGVSAGATGTADDVQAIVATIPKVVAVAFEVNGNGIEASSGARSGPGAPGSRGVDAQSATSEPAETGTDLRLPVILAGGLIVLGSALAALGRRRRAGAGRYAR